MTYDEEKAEYLKNLHKIKIQQNAATRKFFIENTNLNSMVKDFLLEKPDYFHHEVESASNQIIGHPTKQRWLRFSEFLNKNDKPYSKEQLRELLVRYELGVHATILFVFFYSRSFNLERWLENLSEERRIEELWNIAEYRKLK